MNGKQQSGRGCYQWRSIGAVLLVLCVGMSLMRLAWAADVTLTWNANTESDLAGYKLYQSTISGQYGAPAATLGKVTTHTLTLPQIEVDATYYFTLTAYDLAGNESGKSAEVRKLIAGIPAPTPPLLPTPTGFKATQLADGTTQLSWDDMQLPAGAGYLLRVHKEGTPYDPCSSMVWCGGVLMATSKTFTLAPGNYDAWVHSARSESDWGTSQGLAFTVTAPVDLPPAPPQGLTIASATAEQVVIVASATDCARVVTSTKGSTATIYKRTVSCVK